MASLGLRAGFWRRFFAISIDSILITLPLQFLAIWLYPATGGAVQSSGFTAECSNIQRLDLKLEPPPSPHANFARICKSSVFGFETSRTIIVGRIIHNGNFTKSTYDTYYLGTNGQSRSIVHLDWIAALVLFGYLIILESRTGVTFGKYICGIVVVSWRFPGPGIPLLNAIIRQLASWSGLIPILVFFFFDYLTEDENGRAAGEGAFFLIAMGLCGLWYIWNSILVIAKRDPIYDWLARVAVLCK
jgi:hypothetical protein